METTRRGFLGLLAGLVLGGRVLGPKVLAAPSAGTWQARRLCLEDQFVPLSTMTSQVLKHMAEEIEWLRLERQCLSPAFDTGRYDGSHYRYGDTIQVRQPLRFVPSPKDEDYDWRRKFERTVSVNIIGETSAAVEGPIHLDAPWDEVCQVHLRPMALKLAQGIEDQVRGRRGAGLLVSVEQDPARGSFSRSVVASNQDLGLSVRGTIWRDSYGKRRCQFDSVFGLA